MESKKCFIVCPISNEGTPTRKRSDDLLKFIITPACEAFNYEVIRVDKTNTIDKIDNSIIEYLNNSDLVIADLTEENPNAFFELGYRLALGKPVIQMALEETKLPFDISTTRTIFYATNDLEKADRAKESLRATIEAIENRQEALSLAKEESDSSETPVNSQVLTTLFDIKNSIDDLQELVKSSNKDLIKNVMSASYEAIQKQTPVIDSSEALQMQLMTTLFSDPKKLQAILELIEKYPELNKRK